MRRIVTHSPQCAAARSLCLAAAFWTLLAAAQGATLTGLVVDGATSRPLAGATVQYGTQRNPTEPFREDVNRFKDTPLLIDVGSVRTGEDGTFRLEEDSERPAILLVRADGHAWRGVMPAERPQLADRQRPDRLRIELSAGATLSGTVLTTATALPARIQLQRLALPRVPFVEIFPFAATGQDGSYRWERLPAGRYEVGLLEVKDGRSSTVMARTITLCDGDCAALDLGADLGKCSLRGQVVSAKDGKPVAAASVRLQPHFDSAYSQFSAISGDDGRYRFDGLAPGPYGLVVYESDFTGRVAPNASVVVNVAGDTERIVQTQNKR